MTAVRKETVLVFQTPWLTHVIENLVFLISQKPGHRILILTCRKDKAPAGSEHPGALARLQKLDCVEILPEDAPARNSDCVIFRLARGGFLWNRNLNAWAARSRRLGLLSDYYYFEESLKVRAAELIYNFPYWLKADFVIFQTGASIRSPYFFLKTKVFHSPYIHPQYLSDTGLMELLFQSVRPELSRKFRLTFIGNENPESRCRILRDVEKVIQSFPDVVVHKNWHGELLATDKRHVLWIEYGDHDAARGLSPAGYAGMLRESDFCLCPQGWDYWTHRVAECLLCGATPILDHEWIYNLPLEDGRNCLLAGVDGWGNAVRKALGAPESVCRTMRTEAVGMASVYLNVSSMAVPLHELFAEA